MGIPERYYTLITCSTVLCTRETLWRPRCSPSLQCSQAVMFLTPVACQPKDCKLRETPTQGGWGVKPTRTLCLLHTRNPHPLEADDGDALGQRLRTAILLCSPGLNESASLPLCPIDRRGWPCGEEGGKPEEMIDTGRETDRRQGGSVSLFSRLIDGFD